ncbi:MAG: hypothetical protein ACP5I8_01620 [Phycisphaerae bacterium]
MGEDMWKQLVGKIWTSVIGTGIITAGLISVAAISTLPHYCAAGTVAPSPPSVAVATNPPTIGQIRKWITQLASHRLLIRHIAAEKLLAAGDEAVPEMKKALAGLTTPEMRHLLRQDIRKIAHADLLRGPLITLDAKNMSARQAFETVCKQVGVRPHFINQLVLPRVTIHAVREPFWKVMQQLAILTGVSPAQGYYGNPQQITLAANGVLGKGHIVDLAGAFALIPQSINYSRNLNFMQPQQAATQTFNIQAVLLSIPGSTGPMQIPQTVVTKAIDNHGNSLISATPGNVWYGNQMGGVTYFNIALQWPHHPGTIITELKGYIPVMVTVHKQLLDLKFKAKGIAKASIVGVTVSISHRTMQNGMWHFTYTIQQPGGMFNPNSDTQNIMNQLEQINSGTILTAGGRTIQLAGWGGGGGGPQGITYNANINVTGGKPAEFRMVVFTGHEKLEIPFDFKNLSMP